MAATAAYVDIVRLQYSSMDIDDSYSMSNSSPAADTPFNLFGGQYGVTTKASTYGTVTLQKLCGDGTTWVAAMTAVAADGYATGFLATGQYRIHLA